MNTIYPAMLLSCDLPASLHFTRFWPKSSFLKQPCGIFPDLVIMGGNSSNRKHTRCVNSVKIRTSQFCETIKSRGINVLFALTSHSEVQLIYACIPRAREPSVSCFVLWRFFLKGEISPAVYGHQVLRKGETMATTGDCFSEPHS